MMAPGLAENALAGVAAVAGLVLLTGCGCGKEHDHTVYYADGIVTGSEYQSSPVEGPWLHFPGGRRYELVHHLGATPTRYDAYLAFAADHPAEFSIGTGNSARFREVNENVIVVENDTCAGYYLRVVASAPEAPAMGEGGSSP